MVYASHVFLFVMCLLQETGAKATRDSGKDPPQTLPPLALFSSSSSSSATPPPPPHPHPPPLPPAHPLPPSPLPCPGASGVAMLKVVDSQPGDVFVCSATAGGDAGAGDGGGWGLIRYSSCAEQCSHGRTARPLTGHPTAGMVCRLRTLSRCWLSSEQAGTMSPQIYGAVTEGCRHVMTGLTVTDSGLQMCHQGNQTHNISQVCHGQSSLPCVLHLHQATLRCPRSVHPLIGLFCAVLDLSELSARDRSVVQDLVAVVQETSEPLEQGDMTFVGPILYSLNKIQGHPLPPPAPLPLQNTADGLLQNQNAAAQGMTSGRSSADLWERPLSRRRHRRHLHRKQSAPRKRDVPLIEILTAGAGSASARYNKPTHTAGSDSAQWEDKTKVSMSSQPPAIARLLAELSIKASDSIEITATRNKNEEAAALKMDQKSVFTNTPNTPTLPHVSNAWKLGENHSGPERSESMAGFLSSVQTDKGSEISGPRQTTTAPLVLKGGHSAPHRNKDTVRFTTNDRKTTNDMGTAKSDILLLCRLAVVFSPRHDHLDCARMMFSLPEATLQRRPNPTLSEEEVQNMVTSLTNFIDFLTQMVDEQSSVRDKQDLPKAQHENILSLDKHPSQLPRFQHQQHDKLPTADLASFSSQISAEPGNFDVEFSLMIEKKPDKVSVHDGDASIAAQSVDIIATLEINARATQSSGPVNTSNVVRAPEVFLLSLPPLPFPLLSQVLEQLHNMSEPWENDTPSIHKTQGPMVGKPIEAMTNGTESPLPDISAMFMVIIQTAVIEAEPPRFLSSSSEEPDVFGVPTSRNPLLLSFPEKTTESNHQEVHNHLRGKPQSSPLIFSDESVVGKLSADERQQLPSDLLSDLAFDGMLTIRLERLPARYPSADDNVNRFTVITDEQSLDDSAQPAVSSVTANWPDSGKNRGRVTNGGIQSAHNGREKRTLIFASVVSPATNHVIRKRPGLSKDQQSEDTGMPSFAMLSLLVQVDRADGSMQPRWNQDDVGLGINGKTDGAATSSHTGPVTKEKTLETLEELWGMEMMYSEPLIDNGLEYFAGLFKEWESYDYHEQGNIQTRDYHAPLNYLQTMSETRLPDQPAVDRQGKPQQWRSLFRSRPAATVALERENGKQEQIDRQQEKQNQKEEKTGKQEQWILQNGKPVERGGQREGQSGKQGQGESHYRDQGQTKSQNQAAGYAGKDASSGSLRQPSPESPASSKDSDISLFPGDSSALEGKGLKEERPAGPLQDNVFTGQRQSPTEQGSDSSLKLSMHPTVSDKLALQFLSETKKVLPSLVDLPNGDRGILFQKMLSDLQQDFGPKGKAPDARHRDPFLNAFSVEPSSLANPQWYSRPRSAVARFIPGDARPKDSDLASAKTESVKGDRKLPVTEPLKSGLKSVVMKPIKSDRQLLMIEPMAIDRKSPVTGPLKNDKQSQMTEPMKSYYKSLIMEPPNSDYKSLLSKPTDSDYKSKVTNPMKSDRQLPTTQPMKNGHKLLVAQPTKSDHNLPVTQPVKSNHQLPVTEPIKSDHNLSVTQPVKSDHQLPVTEPIKAVKKLSVTQPMISDHQLPVTQPIKSVNQLPLLEPMKSYHKSQVTQPMDSDEKSLITEPLRSDQKSPITEPVSSAQNSQITIPFIRDPLHNERISAKAEQGVKRDFKSFMTELMTSFLGSAMAKPQTSDLKSAIKQPLNKDLKSAMTKPLSSYFKSAMTKLPSSDLKSAMTEDLGSDLKSAMTKPLSSYFKSAMTKLQSSDFKSAMTEDFSSDLKSAMTKPLSSYFKSAMTKLPSSDFKSAMTEDLSSDLKSAMKSGLESAMTKLGSQNGRKSSMAELLKTDRKASMTREPGKHELLKQNTGGNQITHDGRAQHVAKRSAHPPHANSHFSQG